MTAPDPAARLAGFFAAHAVWSVSDGATLIPMLASESAEGSRSMSRLVAEELGDAVARGRKALADNPSRAARAVLLYDGYLTLEAGRFDAIFVEARDYGGGHGFTMAVPYRPAAEGFAVHRPKFIDSEGAEPDWGRMGEEFFAGVDAHEKGAEVWNGHLDQSH
jgi:hypothetical protein